MHGGQARQVRRKASERIATKQQRRKVGDLLAKYDTAGLHPLDALLDCVRRSAAMMQIIGQVLAEGDADDFEERRADLLRMYSDWARLSAQVSKMALDADIDERLIRNAEQTSEMMYHVVARALARSDLTIDQQERFKGYLAAELRAVAASAHSGGRRPGRERRAVESPRT
ncbi:MAG: hypothetical protein ACJ735_07435 [Actinomycetes bacterium]